MKLDTNVLDDPLKITTNPKYSTHDYNSWQAGLSYTKNKVQHIYLQLTVKKYLLILRGKKYKNDDLILSPIIL